MICLCIEYFNKKILYRAYTYCRAGKNEEKTEYFDVEELKKSKEVYETELYQMRYYSIIN